jgi:hypothetical protein
MSWWGLKIRADFTRFIGQNTIARVGYSGLFNKCWGMPEKQAQKTPLPMTKVAFLLNEYIQRLFLLCSRLYFYY